MTQYKVLIDSLGMPGEEKSVQRSRRTHTIVRGTYASKGEVVEIDDDRAESLLAKGYIEKASKADVAEAEQVQTTGEGTEAPLTHKQALVKEAGEMGLDSEGTIPELEARIAKAKREQG
jgi:3-mercaptopyruvate sulfurtransferase SseA